MQLSSVFVSLAFWTSFALGEPLSRASISTVTSDILVLKGAIASLTMQIEGFSGNFFQTASIRAACDELDEANSKTTQDIKSAIPLTEDDGNTIYASVHKSLTPAIGDTFSTLIDKKPMLESLGMSSVVKSSLHDLGEGITPLLDILVDAAPAGQKNRIAQEAQEILAGLKNCESIYSS